MTKTYIPPVLIGSNASGVGKDWLGSELASLDRRFVIRKFAAPLRELAYSLLSLPREKMGDRPWETSTIPIKDYCIEVDLQTGRSKTFHSPTVQDWLIIVGQTLNKYYKQERGFGAFAELGYYQTLIDLRAGNIPIFTDCRQPDELGLLRGLGAEFICVYGDGTKREIDGLLCGQEDLKVSNSGRSLTWDAVKNIYYSLFDGNNCWVNIPTTELDLARQNYKGVFSFCQKLIQNHVKI